MNEDKLKKKYFEYLKSLKGKEMLLPFSLLSEALDNFICEYCPLKDENCEAPCIDKGWEDEFDECYTVKIKVVDFITKRRR